MRKKGLREHYLTFTEHVTILEHKVSCFFFYLPKDEIT
jgi:hypothetical protein